MSLTMCMFKGFNVYIIIIDFYCVNTSYPMDNCNLICNSVCTFLSYGQLTVTSVCISGFSFKVTG